MNSIQNFVTQWTKNAIKKIEKELERQAKIHECDLDLVLQKKAVLRIDTKAGKDEDHYSATWVYVYKKQEHKLIHIEWRGFGFRIFANEKEDRSTRRKNHKEKGKIIGINDKPLITQANIEEMDVHARAQQYLDREKKKPSTTTDSLRDKS